MKTLKNWILVAATLGFSGACERALIRENPQNTPRQNFEILWKTIHERYTYFDLKNVNWDSVYQVYSPQVNNQMPDTSLFRVLDKMLFALRDGHVNLRSPFNVSRNWEWYLNYPENFDYTVVERHYLKDNYRIAGGMQYTVLPGNIGYIYYPSFSSNLNEENLDHIFRYLVNTKGLILDIRNNGGGSLSNVYKIATRLVPQESKSWFRTFKNGPRPRDFSPVSVLEIAASTNDGVVTYPGPVALLTNRKTYSAANTLAGVFYDIPNCMQLGDRTGGGGGIPADYELPNGWVLRFSGSRDITGSGLEFELGIPPSSAVALDSIGLSQGKDAIIEAAIAHFN